MPSPPPARPPGDDELDELPPLDDDASPGAQADVGELLDVGAADDATLDDATGEGDAPDTDELDLGEDERGWLEEPADTPDLELGDAALVELGGDVSAEDVEEPGVEGEDFGLGDGQEHGDLDGGDEGPVGADEELREQDLPDLDADEEGDLEDAALLGDTSFAPDEPAGLAWAAEPWSRVGAPIALASATALACAGRGALVAGRASGAPELALVDLEGASQTLAAEGLDVARVRALEAAGQTVLALTDGGASFVSHDGGARFEPEADAMVTPEAALVRALADADDDAPEARKPAVVAAGDACFAYAGRHGGVVRRGADGAWKAARWDGAVTAIAFVDDAGTLVAATYSEADDTTTLVRLDPEGRASVVARVGASRADAESDGRVLAMAHDAAREVVWVAGGFGVAAFAVR